MYSLYSVSEKWVYSVQYMYQIFCTFAKEASSSLDTVPYHSTLIFFISNILETGQIFRKM